MNWDPIVKNCTANVSANLLVTKLESGITSGATLRVGMYVSHLVYQLICYVQQDNEINKRH